MASDPDLTRQRSWNNHALNQYTISPSGISIQSNTSSSASSSAPSIFSIDAPSVTSSVSSASIGWSGPSWIQHTEGTPCCQHTAGTQPAASKNATQNPFQQSSSAAVAVEARQNPRRTQRLYSQDSQNGDNSARAPPALVRQSDRKVTFVDSLVDTTTQMVETIWPLAAHIQSRPSPTCSRQPSKMALRYFIQEVLRRSKTSYSTLQVALYYLVLIQPHVPTVDFTQEQPDDSASSFSLQCGRRMFIAALILASKYLQDRNFSANAWSKISGLSTWDLNVNELAFVSAINWKLHIPEKVFNRWTDIVLQFSPSSSTSTAPRSPARSRLSWKQVVERLTPDLDAAEFGNAELSDDSGYDSPDSPESSMSPPPVPNSGVLTPPAHEPTPTPATASIPQWLEQTPTAHVPIGMESTRPMLPPMQPHPQLLPTPQLTPQVGSFCTPAVSASRTFSRRSSMSRAMSHVQDASIARCTLDRTTDWRPRVPEGFPTLARRSSLATSASSMSSPDTQISDVSTQYSDASSRPSRSSSISSVASSVCAPAQPVKLAVQATRRCANMQLGGLKGLTQTCLSPSEISRSPQNRTPRPPKCSNDNSSPTAITPTSTSPLRENTRLSDSFMEDDQNLPRCNEHSRASNFNKFDSEPFPRNPDRMNQIDARKTFATFMGFTPPPTSDTREAASALQSLALGNQRQQHLQQHNHQPSNPTMSFNHDHTTLPTPFFLPRTNSAKRARPQSMDFSLEDAVHATIAPRSLADVTNVDNVNISGNGSAVLEDEDVADSFLLRKENRHAVREANKKPTKSVSVVENVPRKKACAGSDRGGREGLRRGNGIVCLR